MKGNISWKVTSANIFKTPGRNSTESVIGKQPFCEI